MKLFLFGILIIIEIAILAIGILIAPKDSGLIYWGTVTWIGFLAGLNWLASASIFSKSSMTSGEAAETGSVLGILPGLNVLIFGYSICSVAILLATTIFGFLGWTWQLVIQIVAFASMAVFGLVMIIASKGAAFGANPKVTKSQILDQLRRIKRITKSNEISVLAEEASTYVTSHMPHPSKLNQESLDSAYQELTSCDPDDTTEATRVLTSITKI